MQKNHYSRGQAMLTAVIFFVIVSLIVILGVSAPILKQIKISKSNFTSKQSYFLAESGIEDSLYRLKTGKNIISGTTVGINGFNSTVTITTTGSGKTIDSISNINGIIRKIESTVMTGVGTAFNYGIQSGAGGFILNGGSKVIGNVYSNGDIVATNGVTITGSAVAADSAAFSADQVNASPATPTDSITFRNSSGTQDFAQSFSLTASSPLNKISLLIKKVGNPSDITVRIVTDSNGSPSTNNMFISNQGTLSASLVSTSYDWVDVVFPENPQLAPNTPYWIVLDNSSQSSSNYYVLAANSGFYTNGMSKTGIYNGTWIPTSLDSYFKVYLGGLISSIGGDTYVGGVNIGSGSIGDAWANSVKGASVAGNLYCQSGQNNNKSCNTTRPDPPAQPYPISDANIADWKSQAVSGGTITGDYHVNYAGATLGQTKITGNLLIDGGGTLTVSGTIWVQGTVTVTGGGKITLASSYGTKSGVIISDSIVSLSGGGSITGSGQSGSYIMILTTSNCPFGPTCAGNNALTLTGGAGAVILNAQNGNMVLNGGSGVHEATAYQISASGGAIITYDSGLASVNFSSGPSGGWNISSLQEVP